MAYQTGTASSQEDLMNVLQTFAVAQGWTLNIMSTTDDWVALNNGSVFVQFRWDNATGIAMFHSLGFTGTGTPPGNQLNDDGCGLVDASAPYNSTVSSGRRINIANGPYTAYHFFTDGTTKYIHVVLEYSPGLYRHFSFGTIDKLGDWTGGQYAAGMFWNEGTSNAFANNGNHAVLWDGTSGTNVNDQCSVHVEGMPNQVAAQKWMLLGNFTSAFGNDRQASPQARIGGLGSLLNRNPFWAAFGPYRASLLNGFLPMIPIPIFWRDTTPNPDQFMLLGFAPNCRIMQIANLSPGQEFSVGADTWKTFPLVRKQNLQQSGVPESRNYGLVYKKVP